MEETMNPVWHAFDDQGSVVGEWREIPGTYMNPEWVRQCRDKYHPGARLRVTRWTKVTEWEEA